MIRAAAARVRRASERRRGLRLAARVAPRWAAGAVVVVAVAVAVALALAGVPSRISGVGDLAANLGRNLLTAAVVGVVAWLWLYSWTSARATRRLRADARRAPHGLFPIRPRVGSATRVVGRDLVVAEIAANVGSDFRAGPQVLVGETGSGKTSVLLKLAEHFAERDVLPIVLSLRGLEEIDFAELAKQRFREYVDPHLRSEEDADKLWRWMARRGKVLVLADDLDRARLSDEAADPYRLEARLALDAARRRDLPLVVASRPQGVPPDLPEPPIALGALEWSGDPEADLERAVATVAERAGRRGDREAERLARASIERGEVLSNAFYLEVVGELLRADALREPPADGPHAVRIGLLDTWRDSVRGDRTVPEAVRRRRERMLGELERFAVDRLPPPARREHAGAATADEREWADALHFGEAAGILEVEDDGGHRFAHEVVHAYFAARRLPGDEAGWRRAIDVAPDSPRVQLALVLAAASARRSADAVRPRFCEAVCAALLDGGDRLADEQRLQRAAAAAEVAQAGRCGALDDRIADECIAARADAGVVARRAAVDRLADLTGERAVLALWGFAGDGDYGVRWRAAQRLVARCPAGAARAGVATGHHAYAALAGEIADRLADARRCLDAGRQPDDWEPEIRSLKHMAWMLPALRTRAQRAGDAELARAVERDLRELLALEAAGVTRQKGLEASIAQGLKTDALMHPDEPIDEDVRALLARRGSFWYSQLNLVHAVALRARPDDRALELIQPFRAAGGHPFVRAAADLCADALRRGDVRRHVWEDEAALVAHRPGGLAPVAIQLVGEIVVLLNMNEGCAPAQRERFGSVERLPHCLAGSRSRVELFDDRVGCRATCDLRLCPYRPPATRISAYRELSRPFCRHQRLHATPANARRWGAKVSRRALREQWRWLEAAARA